MNDFIVKAVRSDDIYRKILNASMDKKDDIYRYEFMQQFEKKWEMYHCPLKAKQPGGYDVVMASGMLGYLLRQKIGKKEEAYIEERADDKLWAACAASIEQSLMQFANMGIDLRVKEYLFTLALADPESPYSIMCDNYSGDGGIPGCLVGGAASGERKNASDPGAYGISRAPSSW